MELTTELLLAMASNLETCLDLGGVATGRCIQHSDLFTVWLDVKAALLAMPPRDRYIVVLMGQGFTDREVGEQLGVSHQAVNRRFHRILARLKTSLEPGRKGRRAA